MPKIEDGMLKTLCISCGCSFDHAAYENGGVIHDLDMGENEWICEKCDNPEDFELNKKAMKLLRDNNIFFNCPKCGNRMKISFQRECLCGVMAKSEEELGRPITEEEMEMVIEDKLKHPDDIFWLI